MKPFRKIKNFFAYVKYYKKYLDLIDKLKTMPIIEKHDIAISKYGVIGFTVPVKKMELLYYYEKHNDIDYATRVAISDVIPDILNTMEDLGFISAHVNERIFFLEEPSGKNLDYNFYNVYYFFNIRIFNKIIERKRRKGLI